MTPRKFNQRRDEQGLVLHEAQHVWLPVIHSDRRIFTGKAAGPCTCPQNVPMNHPRDFPLCESGSSLAWSANGWMAQLGEGFFTWVDPQPVAQPHWVGRSTSLATQLGLSAWLESENALAVLSGSATSARQPRSLATRSEEHTSELQSH